MSMGEDIRVEGKRKEGWVLNTVGGWWKGVGVQEQKNIGEKKGKGVNIDEKKRGHGPPFLIKCRRINKDQT